MNATKLVFLAATGIFSVFLGASGVAYLVGAEPMVEALTVQLGFPGYFLWILGTWKVLGAVALLTPATVSPWVPRIKEWAYAGFFFNITGAVASHLLAGHGLGGAMPAIVMFALLLTSYGLRPEAARLHGIEGTPATA